MIELRVKAEYFNQILDGIKTVEGRIAKGQYKRLRIGDAIRFIGSSNPMEYVDVTVIGIHHYATFRAMLEGEGYQSCIPTAQSIEDAEQIYLSFPNYVEESARFGVIAIIVSYCYNNPGADPTERQRPIDKNRQQA